MICSPSPACSNSPAFSLYTACYHSPASTTPQPVPLHSLLPYPSLLHSTACFPIIGYFPSPACFPTLAFSPSSACFPNLACSIPQSASLPQPAPLNSLLPYLPQPAPLNSLLPYLPQPSLLHSTACFPTPACSIPQLASIHCPLPSLLPPSIYLLHMRPAWQPLPLESAWATVVFALV